MSIAPRPLPRFPVLLTVLSTALLMVLTGCGDTADEAADPSSTAELANTDDEAEQGSDQGSVSDGAQPGELMDRVYICEGVSLPLDQLTTLDSLPAPDGSDFYRIAAIRPLGDREQWAQLAPGILVDRTPLMSDPPGLVMALDDREPVACIATLDSEDRPVAWRAETGIAGTTTVLTASIESCVNPSDVLVRTGTVDDDFIIAMSLEAGTVSEEIDCVVDGSKQLDVPLPADFDGKVLSSQTWPFSPPNPDAWVTLNDAPLVAPIEPSDLSGALCVAAGEVGEVRVGWWDVPGGVAQEILADGELLTSAGRSTAARLHEKRLAATYLERLRDYGVETSSITDLPAGDAGARPDPDQVFSLFGAPPEPGSFYELRLTAPGATVTIPCGNAGTLSAAETSGCDIDSSAQPQCSPNPPSDPTPGQIELEDARELFNRSVFGAHVYMTLVVDGLTTERYIDPGRSFSPPLEGRFLNPFTLHEELIAAITDGQDIDYGLDTASGAVTTWSVDGAERELLCLEVDTAPPSLRQTDCDPTLDVIGD